MSEMAAPSILALLAAVRRRLWCGQFVAAVRSAAWASAGWLLLAVAVQLTAGRVPPGTVAWPLAALWACAAVWALWRRPANPACALWADRHLGGASAFTTWLELRNGMPGSASVPALRSLEAWATAQVPRSLQRLAERRDAPDLARPLGALGVCAVLAGAVLALPSLAPVPPSPATAAAAADAGDRPSALAQDPAAADLASEIASALRPQDPADSTGRLEGGPAQAAGSGRSDDGAVPPAGPSDPAPPAERSAAEARPDGRSVDAPAPAHATQAPGTGAGRDAGDGRDERADVGVSRAPRSALAVQRWSGGVLRPSPERQADLHQPGTYDEQDSMRAGAVPGSAFAPPAATPPPAQPATRMTPSEANYVQAWMKANAPRR